MKATRQAIMSVSRVFLEELLPDWRVVVKLRYGDVVEQDRPESIVEALYHVFEKDGCRTPCFTRWEGPAVETAPSAKVTDQCWSCKAPTARHLSTGEAECKACAERPLL